VSGAKEGSQLPDGQFQPPMALNVVAARAEIAAQWPERCLTIGRTANLTEASPTKARAVPVSLDLRAGLFLWRLFLDAIQHAARRDEDRAADRHHRCRGGGGGL
jgi:hypothetical protein